MWSRMSGDGPVTLKRDKPCWAFWCPALSCCCKLDFAVSERGFGAQCSLMFSAVNLL